jgi:hypothetical protein
LDPYVSGVLKKSPYVNKKVVKGNIVVILGSIIEKRGLNLIIPHSSVSSTLKCRIETR